MHPVRIQERKNKKSSVSNSQTRAEKAKAHVECTEANKQGKRIIRTDNKFLVDIVGTVKKDTAKENI